MHRWLFIVRRLGAKRTLPLESKGGQVGNDLGELLGEKVESLAHEDKFGVVGDEAAGST